MPEIEAQPGGESADAGRPAVGHAVSLDTADPLPAAPSPALDSPEAAEPSPAVGSSALDSPVAAALAQLGTLSALELNEHPDAYQRIHAELQSALSAIDDA